MCYKYILSFCHLDEYICIKIHQFFLPCVYSAVQCNKYILYLKKKKFYLGKRLYQHGKKIFVNVRISITLSVCIQIIRYSY